LQIARNHLPDYLTYLKPFLGNDANIIFVEITSKPQVANGQWLILIFKELRQDLILKLLQAKLFSK